jgi:hypothetical protein
MQTLKGRVSDASLNPNEDNMTTITRTPDAAVPAPTEERELAVDSLNLRDAVIGDGLVLTETEDRRFVIHTLDSGRAQLLGSFDSVARALEALDELEQDC